MPEPSAADLSMRCRRSLRSVSGIGAAFAGIIAGAPDVSITMAKGNSRVVDAVRHVPRRMPRCAPVAPDVRATRPYDVLNDTILDTLPRTMEP